MHSSGAAQRGTRRSIGDRSTCSRIVPPFHGSLVENFHTTVVFVARPFLPSTRETGIRFNHFGGSRAALCGPLLSSRPMMVYREILLTRQANEPTQRRAHRCWRRCRSREDSSSTCCRAECADNAVTGST